MYALNYGGVHRFFQPNVVVYGAGDMAQSSRELSAFVNRVRASTGASQVDVVGHSQGGTLARQYLKFDGGADPSDPNANAVHSLVTLGATNHGTSFGGLASFAAPLAALGVPVDQIAPLWMLPAGAQQLIGSPTLARLNDGSDVAPGVDYTIVATRFDRVSTPPERTFLDASGSADVHNVWVQDVCPSATTSHEGLLNDDAAAYIVQSALDPAYASSTPAPCAP